MAKAFEAPNESFCSSWLGVFRLLLLKILLYKEATFAGTTSMSLIRSKSGRALVPICACILKVVLDLLLQVFRLFLPAQQWWYKLLGCDDTRSDMIWELKKWQHSKPQGVKQVTQTQNPSTYVQSFIPQTSWWSKQYRIDLLKTNEVWCYWEAQGTVSFPLQDPRSMPLPE